MFNGKVGVPLGTIRLTPTFQTQTETVTIPSPLPSGRAPELQVVTPGMANATVDIRDASVTPASASQGTGGGGQGGGTAQQG
ncbi:MAG: hypothetical protein ACYCOU_24335 [Sulfobacillus sp.]